MYLKVFEKVKYFRKIFKYKYDSFLKVKYQYFGKVFKYFQMFDPMSGYTIPLLNEIQREFLYVIVIT